MDEAATYEKLVAASARFANTWWKADDFWTRSNQFHSYLQLYSLASKIWTSPGKDFWTAVLEGENGMLSVNLRYFNSCIGKSKYWTDDYGWAGIASVKASEYYQNDEVRAKVGEAKAAALAQAWCNTAIKCFDYIADHWEKTDTGTPIKHSINMKLCKNTVTNANCLAMSLHMYQLLKRYNYLRTGDTKLRSLNYAYNAMIWFRQWIKTLPSQHAPDGIPYTYSDPVQNIKPHGQTTEEWPYTSLNGSTDSYPPMPNPSGEPHGVWTGDQGVFVHSCAMLYNNLADLRKLLHVPTAELAAIEADITMYMRQIPAGLYYALCHPDGDYIFREAPYRYLHDPYAYGADYLSGRGTFCRFYSDADTRAAFASLNINMAPFSKVFAHSASAASFLDAPYAAGQFKSEWAPTNVSAYQIFASRWGSGDVSSYYTDPDANSANWKWFNQAQMNGFDVIGALIFTWFLGDDEDEDQCVTKETNVAHLFEIGA